MTGEITLRGRCSASVAEGEDGGRAANRIAQGDPAAGERARPGRAAGEVKAGIQFHPVRTMDEVLAVALARAVDVRPSESPAALVTH
jgi:hypothetical protein